MSSQTGTWTECLYTEPADFTALASFTSEASLLGGQNLQPTLFPSFFEGIRAKGKALHVLARGVLSVTGTPSYTFTLRIGSTLASVGSGLILISAAIPASSGVTNAWWQLEADLVCRTPGQGSTNLTLSGTGTVCSFTGFASPFFNVLLPSQASAAAWTATIDGSVTNYVNLSATCTASNASNTIQCKQLVVSGRN